jgi:hypothetical protein
MRFKAVSVLSTASFFASASVVGAQIVLNSKGDITDNPDGTITLHPRNSKTDMVLWQIGLTLAIPQGTGH